MKRRLKRLFLRLSAVSIKHWSETHAVIFVAMCLMVLLVTFSVMESTEYPEVLSQAAPPPSYMIHYHDRQRRTQRALRDKSRKQEQQHQHHHHHHHHQQQKQLWQDAIPRRKETRVDCAAIIDGDVRETQRATALSARLRDEEPGVGMNVYLEANRDCDAFRDSRGYIMSPLSQEEAEFPLAFSIVLYTDVEMAERLLRAIYRPHNYYCLHIDARATHVFKAFQRVASCFSNVVLASRRVQVVWSTFTVLEADLVCMETLWRFRKWRYFINLTGQEFPLKTNADLVRILKALNGSNDVHATLEETYQDRKRFEHAPPPSWFRPIKGSVHVAVSRAFVDFLLHDSKAAFILKWVKTTDSMPDETFFSTLNHNPHLGAPGSYAGHPESTPDRKPFLSRYKVWNTKDDYYCHSGVWVRHICILTSGDLPLMVRSVHLFANKFFLQQDRLAISCLEEYLYNVTVDRIKGKSQFNTSYYENLEFVRNQVQPVVAFSSRENSYGIVKHKLNLSIV